MEENNQNFTHPILPIEDPKTPIHQSNRRRLIKPNIFNQYFFKRTFERRDTEYVDDQPHQIKIKLTCSSPSWSFVPVLLSIISSVGFIVTYAVAKSNCHLEEWIIPYLSHTGTEYPESMMLGMFMSVEGFLAFVVVFIAWHYYRHMRQPRRWNTTALVFGSVSCLGVVMVSNFQVTKAQVPHYLGAALAFFIGNFYVFITSFLSRGAFRIAQPSLKYGTVVVGIRFFLATLMFVCLIVFLGLVIYKKTGGNNFSKVRYNSQRINDSCVSVLESIPLIKQKIDLVSALSEWIAIASLTTFFGLFAYEFKAFQSIKVVLQRNHIPLNVQTEICQTI